MTAFWIGVVASIITGALVNEFCDVSPWLAVRMVRRAARLWSVGDRETAAEYEAEWAAVIADCPGKLTKVVRASVFLGGAVMRASRHRLKRLSLLLQKQRVSLPQRKRGVEATYVVREELPGGHWWRSRSRAYRIKFDDESHMMRFDREISEAGDPWLKRSRRPWRRSGQTINMKSDDGGFDPA